MKIEKSFVFFVATPCFFCMYVCKLRVKKQKKKKYFSLFKSIPSGKIFSTKIRFNFHPISKSIKIFLKKITMEIDNGRNETALVN